MVNITKSGNKTIEIKMKEILVEKRKISYFGLVLNLFQHLVSTNQDDQSYSARTFISAHQSL